MVNVKGGGYHIIKRSIRMDSKTPKDILKELGITPKMAMVWFLYKKMGYPQKEIAAYFGMSKSKISRIYKRAVQVLDA